MTWSNSSDFFKAVQKKGLQLKFDKDWDISKRLTWGFNQHLDEVVCEFENTEILKYLLKYSKYVLSIKVDFDVQIGHQINIIFLNGRLISTISFSQCQIISEEIGWNLIIEREFCDVYNIEFKGEFQEAIRSLGAPEIV